jgi:hypothetical protein
LSVRDLYCEEEKLIASEPLPVKFSTLPHYFKFTQFLKKPEFLNIQNFSPAQHYLKFTQNSKKPTGKFCNPKNCTCALKFFYTVTMCVKQAVVFKLMKWMLTVSKILPANHSQQKNNLFLPIVSGNLNQFKYSAFEYNLI